MDTKYQKGLDVVVVNYRTPHLLKNFVDSYFFQSSSVETELVIVDVDPTEESYEECREFLTKYDEVFQYWPMMNDNCGYSGACNFASTATNREVIAFFNSDTKLFDDTLDKCYDYLMANDDVAICGPMQVDSNGLVRHAGVFGTNTRPQIRGWVSKNSSLYKDVRDDCVTVFGSAYFVKRSVWDEMTNHPIYRELYPNANGAFLPTQHYYEETWCSYFARHLGYKVAYVGDTCMIHEWHKSSPVGAIEGQVMRKSRQMFRDACDHFGIERD